MSIRHLALIAIGVIWGSEWIATRAIEAPPLRAAAVRLAVAAAVLGAIGVSRRMKLPERARVGALLLSGVTMIAFPVLLTLWAGQRMSPGLAVVLLAATPLMAALIEGAGGGAWLTPLVGGVGGTALAVSAALSFSAGQLMGAMAMLLAALSIAWSAVFIKRRLGELSPLTIASFQLGSGALVLGLASWLVERADTSQWTVISASCEIILSLLANALAFPLYYWLLRRIEARQVTSVQWVATVAGILESSFLVRQAPSWRMLAGTFVMLASFAALLRMRPEGDASLTLEITERHSPS